MKETEVPLILEWNRQLQIYLVASLEDYDPTTGDVLDFERVEYQVSNGLPGDRTSSQDFDTFDEAKTAFDARCVSELRRRRRTNPGVIPDATWDAAACVWRGPPPDEVGEDGAPR